MKNEFLKRLQIAFPDFAAKLGDGSTFGLDNVQTPATDDNLRDLEQSLGLLLPESYKALLRCSREFWLGSGVQFGHPFLHDFEPFDALTPQQQRSILHKGVSWPPPSQGMLCFAEFFMEADGDQVLFDVSRGLVEGEYPVIYYAHESSPPSVRQLTATFPEFMANHLLSGLS